MNEEAGPRIFGPFELLEKVGRGGMGVVFRARHQETGNIVAIKIATQAMALESSYAKRFEKEYSVSSQLFHPRIVRTLSFGTENKVPYMVMEFVPGLSLDKWIRQKGPLSEQQAISIFSQISDALHFLHGQNIIHRDVKPGNILLDEKGNAKLGDMGLVKDLDSEVVLTRSNVGLGTYEYSAPEQLDDARLVDARCDVYSLAATLYMALTAKFPFGRGGQLQLMERKLGYQFTPVRQIIPSLSTCLDQTISQSLHPDPDKRPASCLDFKKGLLGQMHFGADPLPPGTQQYPKRERRGTIRYALHWDATCQPTATPPQGTWQATILDVSAHGLCFQCSCEFVNDTVLQVKMTDKDPKLRSSFMVRVRWAKPVSEKLWIVGGSFLKPLNEMEMKRICVEGLPETKVI